MKPALTAEEWKVGRVWFRQPYGEDAIRGEAPNAPDKRIDFGVELVADTPQTRDDPHLWVWDGSWAVQLDENTKHALAALCLHGQDFGFTREDVVVLRSVQGEMEASAKIALNVEAEAKWAITAGCIEHICDRIEALLPPEE